MFAKSDHFSFWVLSYVNETTGNLIWKTHAPPHPEWFSALGKLLNIAHEREMPTVTLCHGPAALLSTCLEGTGKTECAYKDYKTMCFTDKTDAFTPKVGYTPGAMPWKCQAAIEEKGLTVLNTKETGATTVDRELISGDSPTAANNLGIVAAPLMVEYATSMANKVEAL